MIGHFLQIDRFYPYHFQTQYYACLRVVLNIHLGMAKVIRQCWVWKPHYRWHVYLPRRNDGLREYDFEANNATPSSFPEPMPEEPPKLWLVWFYRDLSGEPRWTKEHIRRLFGGDPTPGDMHVFKNTADINKQLWHMKHLIELRPMRFPNGEPTEADINHLEVSRVNAEGRG